MAGNKPSPIEIVERFEKNPEQLNKSHEASLDGLLKGADSDKLKERINALKVKITKKTQDKTNGVKEDIYAGGRNEYTSGTPYTETKVYTTGAAGNGEHISTVKYDTTTLDTNNIIPKVKPSNTKANNVVPTELTGEQFSTINQKTHEELHENGVDYTKTVALYAKLLGVETKNGKITQEFVLALMKKQDELGVTVDGIIGEHTMLSMLIQSIPNKISTKEFVAIANDTKLDGIIDSINGKKTLSTDQLSHLSKSQETTEYNSIKYQILQETITELRNRKDPEHTDEENAFLEGNKKAHIEKQGIFNASPEGVALNTELKNKAKKAGAPEGFMDVIMNPDSKPKDIAKAFFSSGLGIDLLILGFGAYLIFGEGSFLQKLGIGALGGLTMLIAAKHGLTPTAAIDKFWKDGDKTTPSPDTPSPYALTPEEKEARDNEAEKMENSTLSNLGQVLEKEPKLQLKRYLTDVEKNSNTTNKISGKDAESIYHNLNNKEDFKALTIIQLENLIRDLDDSKKAEEILKTPPFNDLKINGNAINPEQLKVILLSLRQASNVETGKVADIFSGEKTVVQAVVDTVTDGVDTVEKKLTTFYNYISQELTGGEGLFTKGMTPIFEGWEKTDIKNLTEKAGGTVDAATASIIAFASLSKEKITELINDGIIVFKDSRESFTIPDDKLEAFNKALGEASDYVYGNFEKVFSISEDLKTDIKGHYDGFTQVMQDSINSVLAGDISIQEAQSEILKVLEELPSDTAEAANESANAIKDALTAAVVTSGKALTTLWEEGSEWMSDVTTSSTPAATTSTPPQKVVAPKAETTAAPKKKLARNPSEYEIITNRKFTALTTPELETEEGKLDSLEDRLAKIKSKISVSNAQIQSLNGAINSTSTSVPRRVELKVNLDDAKKDLTLDKTEKAKIETQIQTQKASINKLKVNLGKEKIEKSKTEAANIIEDLKAVDLPNKNIDIEDVIYDQETLLEIKKRYTLLDDFYTPAEIPDLTIIKKYLTSVNTALNNDPGKAILGEKVADVLSAQGAEIITSLEALLELDKEASVFESIMAQLTGNSVVPTDFLEKWYDGEAGEATKVGEEIKKSVETAVFDFEKQIAKCANSLNINTDEKAEKWKENADKLDEFLSTLSNKGVRGTSGVGENAISKIKEKVKNQLNPPTKAVAASAPSKTPAKKVTTPTAASKGAEVNKADDWESFMDKAKSKFPSDYDEFKITFIGIYKDTFEESQMSIKEFLTRMPETERIGLHGKKGNEIIEFLIKQ